MSPADRPVLAVVFGEGTATPMVLAESAHRAGCALVWVVDSDTLREQWLLRLLRRLGTTVDMAAMSDDEAADALRRCQPAGIITYADALIPVTSRLATRLGLDFHRGDTVARLTDKLAQREALRAGSVAVPRFVVVPPHPTSSDLDAVASQVDFPVVLKPRQGAGGRDTVLARDLGELRRFLAEQADTESMIIEEYLVGASPPPSPLFADYVSVESVVCGATVSHVAVTGRFPLAEPFRESGFVLPSDLGPSDTTDVLDTASRAIAALGVRIGFLHTEIKLTPHGPRVIEVNGRLGGAIPALVAQAAGVDLMAMSQRVALGERVVFDGLIPTTRIGFLFYVQPPQSAHRVQRVEGLDQLAQLPGVDSVSLARQPGDDVDWRKGSHEYVFMVVGAADDYQGVVAVKRFIDQDVTMAFD